MKLRVLLLSVCLLTSYAHANDISQATADVNPELFRGKALRKIPDMTWEEVPASVQYINVGGVREPVARFRGKVLSLSGSNLLYTIDGVIKTAKVSDDGMVEILVPLTKNRVSVGLRAIDQYGKTYDDGIVVSSSVGEKNSGKRVNIDVGVGFSMLNYVEKFGSQEFKVSELGVTVKSGANYQLAQRWEIGGNGFITAIPIGLSMQPSGLIPARWFGLNGRVGYRVYQPSPRASYHLLAGWYVWGMLTTATSNAFIYGVERLGGPQIFLTARFRLRNRRMLNIYTKFATIQDQGIFSSVNREIALGGALQISPPVEGRRRFMMTLDVANAAYSNQHPTASKRQSFHLNSYSLGIGTNF